MSENIIFTFDVCSSTSMLEVLHRTNMVDHYASLIGDIIFFLEKNSRKYRYDVYKYLGDGFILIFDRAASIDEVLEFSISLTADCNSFIHDFISNFVESDDSIRRRGITIGVDKGTITKLTIDNEVEYVGRPINYSCRLQSSLSGEEHVNKLLLSLKVYREIERKEYKILCTETKRKFKNIANGESIKCYEFNPLYFIRQDPTELREILKKKIKKDEQVLEAFINSLAPEILQSSTTVGEERSTPFQKESDTDVQKRDP